MSGEADLAKMLATISMSQRPGTFAFVSLLEVSDDLRPDATIVEDEGTTVVVSTRTALERGWNVVFEAAWLTSKSTALSGRSALLRPSQRHAGIGTFRATCWPVRITTTSWCRRQSG